MLDQYPINREFIFVLRADLGYFSRRNCKVDQIFSKQVVDKTYLYNRHSQRKSISSNINERLISILQIAIDVNQ